MESARTSSAPERQLVSQTSLMGSVRDDENTDGALTDLKHGSAINTARNNRSIQMETTHHTPLSISTSDDMPHTKYLPLRLPPPKYNTKENPPR